MPGCLHILYHTALVFFINVFFPSLNMMSIRGQLIFAWVGGSFENSDEIFSSMGVTNQIGPWMVGEGGS